MSKLKNAIGWRLSTAFIWAAVAMSGWYWMQAALAASHPAKMEDAPASVLPDMFNAVALARLLGSTSPAQAGPGPGPTERFVLSGVIASSTGQGAALISVDGKSPRPFAVGSELAPGYVLVAVGAREAMLGEGLNSPVRAVLTIPLQRPTEVTAALPGVASSAPSTFSVLPLPAATVAGTSGTEPLTAPVAAEKTTPVPARADARRQPQTSLQRQDTRTP